MNQIVTRALIVDPNESREESISSMLASSDSVKFESCLASSYSESLNRLLEDQFSVCIADLEIGLRSIVDLISSTRMMDRFVPIIVIADETEIETERKLAEAGVAIILNRAELTGQSLKRAIVFAISQHERFETLRESEHHFRSIIESANDAIILATENGRIISCNQSAQTIFGYTQTALVGMGMSELFPADLFHTNNEKGIDAFLHTVLSQHEKKSKEFNAIRSDGHEFAVEVTVSTWTAAHGSFYSAIIRDVTERKTLEEQLTLQALHDPLTKLANRALFRNRVAHAISKFKRNRSRVGILFLDLDDFKKVNDTLGHAAGDELLIGVASRLDSCLRTGDTAARLGGDEFAVIVEGANHPSDIEYVAERIRESIRAPFKIEGKDIFVGTSIGIATTDDGTESPEELLRNADVAMYIAKAAGKDQYAIFEGSMHDEIMQRARLESDLRMGIYREEFEIYYQPIMELSTGRLMGMEALVRWNHPDRGILSPDTFIKVAEETNLIIPLGRWVLDEACCKTLEWQSSTEYGEDLSITINITARQFQDAALVSTIEDALAMSGLPPRSLILEIPESAMLQNTETTIKKLTDLKNIGVRLAIDDFGTGYSSLSHLQNFPVDILKIDRSFIEKLVDSDAGAAVAKAIITMGDTLKLSTIAEGIENLAQSVELKSLGCVMGQGFHFAEPLPTDRMDEFLQNTPQTVNRTWDQMQTGPIIVTNEQSGLPF